MNFLGAMDVSGMQDKVTEIATLGDAQGIHIPGMPSDAPMGGFLNTWGDAAVSVAAGQGQQVLDEGKRLQDEASGHLGAAAGLRSRLQDEASGHLGAAAGQLQDAASGVPGVVKEAYESATADAQYFMQMENGVQGTFDHEKSQLVDEAGKKLKDVIWDQDKGQLLDADTKQVLGFMVDDKEQRVTGYGEVLTNQADTTKDIPSDGVATKTRGGSKDASKDKNDSKDQLGYGRFQHPDRQSPSEYIWIPKTIDLDSELVDKVMKHWRLEKPTLLLCFDSGFAHPLHLIGDDIMDFDPRKPNKDNKFPEHCVLYEKFSALQDVVKREHVDEKGDMNELVLKSKRADSINKILKRLVFSIVRTIVQVASQQNIWIVVQGRPTGITVILEEALKEYQNNIVVLVLDCPAADKYTLPKEKESFYASKKKFKKVIKVYERCNEECDKGKARDCVDYEKLIAGDGKVDSEVDRDGRKVCDGDDVDFKAWAKEMTKRNTRTLELVNDMNVELLKQKRPLDQAVEQVWSLAGILNKKGKQDWLKDWTKDNPYKKGWPQQSASDVGAESVRWNQFFFSYGTHYLLMDRDTSEDLDLSLFGPKGSVYLGGGGSTKDSIQESMRLGEPTVLIHNTGRATQQLVILHEQLIKHYRPQAQQQRKEEEAGDDIDAGHKWIKKLAQLIAVENKDSSLDMSDIVEMNQLYQQRVHIIEQTCVVIDPLDQATSEQHVLTKVSDCFAANYRISTSVAYEAACRRAVASAWQLHAQLCASCAVQKKWNDMSLIVVLILGFLAIVASILILEVERGGDVVFGAQKGSDIHKTLTLLVIILPTASGLVNTLSSRMRFKETWGLMKSASCLIEAEIFKFRVRVREYAVVGSGKEGSDRQGRERQVRDRFMAKVEQIFQDYLADIGGAALKRAIPIQHVPPYAECASVLSLHQQGGFGEKREQGKASQQIVKAHSKKFQATSVDDAQKLAKVAKQRQVNREAKAKKKGKPLHDTKDGTADATMSPELGNFSAQKYYKNRMLPTLHTMTEEAQRLQKWVNTSEVLIGGSAVLGSILGALNTGSDGQTVAFVPLCVTFGSIVTSLMQQNALYARLTAVNASVRSLSRLDLDWNSASPLEQCSLAKITELVETTETARITVMNAWTTVTATTKNSPKNDGGEGGGGKGENGGEKKD